MVVYSPNPDDSFSRMSADNIRRVIDVWADQYVELGSRDEINYVQIFENRGSMMGASNPHPHCQVWANERVPTLPQKKSWHQKEYSQFRGRVMLLDYLAIELDKRDRIVFESDHFVTLVPFWAVWPFETMILPRRHRVSVADLDDDERLDLADCLRRITARYDNMFKSDFPYSMGVVQKPTDGQDHGWWQMYVGFTPPLLRSATVRKFMVGYELFAMAQRDITPEQAAERLRELPDTRFDQA